MAKKSVFVCVQKDINQLIKWALQSFESRLDIMYFDNTPQLGVALADEDNCAMIILDSIVNDVSTLDFAKEIKNKKPSVNILLIASSGTSKETLVDAIQTKTISGVLMRPFTAQQVNDYIYKFCGFQKPTDSPWHAKK
ncbi:MAG: hypothetical protein HZB79_09970 [Deltaproteobacteria bacterium]|nr:hypothetical protein [Deltaproteobacteria bacterium]